MNRNGGKKTGWFSKNGTGEGLLKSVVIVREFQKRRVC